MSMFVRLRYAIDWWLVAAVVPLIAAGLATMYSFTEANEYFNRQLVWVLVGAGFFFIASAIDWRFLRRTKVVVWCFVLSAVTLLLVFMFGTVTKGALSRFDIGAFFIQPSDPIKLVLIIVLAKYFSRRHIEISELRHVFISGVYAFILFALVFLQPDFGSAIILFFIWLGMVLVSGISKWHLAGVFGGGALVFMMLWMFAFQDYQKERIMTFLNPLADIQGAGYSAYQSTIAVGSGQLLGKGFGYGTQSRLQFLPEYETDFIFAAFAEEWGFVGVLVLFMLFGMLLWRLVVAAMHGATNFETFFTLGVAILIGVHAILHIGINIGIFPVTGTTLPFLSYGGSHVVMEMLGLGMVMGMRAYRRGIPQGSDHNEFVGPQ